MEEILSKILAEIHGLKDGQTAMNARLDKMDNRLDRMENDIKTLKKDSKEIKTNVKHIWEDIKRLDDRLLVQESKIKVVK